MRVSELLGARVTTVSGKRLGRVHDVRAELGSETLAITGVVVGGFGLLERLGLGARARAERLRTKNVVPWQDVLSASRHAVVVRDQAS